jgi:hypothetical protein
MYNIYSHSHGTGATTVAMALAAMGNGRVLVNGEYGFRDDVYLYSGRTQNEHGIYDFGWAQDYTSRIVRDRGDSNMYRSDSTDTNVLVVSNAYASLKRANDGERYLRDNNIRTAPQFVVCVMDSGRAIGEDSMGDVLSGSVGEHARFVFVDMEASVKRSQDAGLFCNRKVEWTSEHLAGRLQRIVDAMLSQPLL